MGFGLGAQGVQVWGFGFGGLATREFEGECQRLKKKHIGLKRAGRAAPRVTEDKP